MAQDTPHQNQSFDIKQTPVSRLVALHTAVVNELLARHLGHTRTSPVADLPDLLVTEAYEGELVAGQPWSVEALGRKLLVRGRMRLPADRASTAYAPITDWSFDAGVFLVLDGLTCEVVKAVEVPADQLRSLVPSGASTSTARIRINVDLTELSGARDVTTEIDKAMAKVDAERYARRSSDDADAAADGPLPSGTCLCGCGQPAEPGARFIVMHDRRAESPNLCERISGLVVT